MSDLMEIGSLDELAALFEGRARAARDRIKPATPNMRVALLREQAATWEDAAALVRGTIMSGRSGAANSPTPPGARGEGLAEAMTVAPPRHQGYR